MSYNTSSIKCIKHLYIFDCDIIVKTGIYCQFGDETSNNSTSILANANAMS